MSERISWTEHKGKKILYVDFSDLENSQDIVNLIKEAKEEVLKNNEVLLLVNTVGSRGSPDVIKEFKALLVSSKGKIKKGAVYCVSRVHKIFLKSIRTFTSFKLEEFDSIEKAKNYLAE